MTRIFAAQSFLTKQKKDMKHFILFLALGFLASCSKDEAPDPIQGSWETLKGITPHAAYTFAEDGQMCERIEFNLDYCGMRWDANGADRYFITRNDAFDGVWFVRVISARMIEVRIQPTTPDENDRYLYLERTSY